MVTFPLSHDRTRRPALRRERVRDAASGARRLRLVASGGGWSLVTLEGEPVFSADGLRGRGSCLEFAHNQGVVALVS